jgi:hypothetical protein
VRVELEIFAVRPEGEVLRYSRRRLDVTPGELDPDRTVGDYVETLVRRPLQEGAVLTHSTSWRYIEPATVVLTYLCYSQAFETNEDWQSLDVDDVDAKAGRAVSSKSPEADVLAHGLRHFAFLIKNGVLCSDDGPACESAIETLSPLAAEAAGRR